MREIKFRGKRVKDGKWIYGSLDVMYDGVCFISFWIDRVVESETNAKEMHQINYKVEPETVGQFTGLKDKEGNDIYEGDIIEHTVTHDPKRVGQIFRNQIDYYNGSVCGWRFGNKSFRKNLTENWIFNQEPIVIGNIHDNKLN